MSSKGGSNEPKNVAIKTESLQAATGLSSEEDALVLAKMGYKQELKRNFSTLEIFGFAFSITGLFPSIASTLLFSLPAGPIGLVWGWFLASGLIFLVGLALAELGSAMPTAGGLYYWTHYYSSPKVRDALCFLVGYSNTIGLIGGVCGITYGFALQFLSVIIIARDGTWFPSNGVVYATYLAAIICHAIIACFANKIIGKLQTVATFLQFALILSTIIALPIGTSYRNDASFIFTKSYNFTAWPTGWTFMLSFLSPIWTMAGISTAVNMSEEALNAAKAVPLGLTLTVGCGWILGWICVIVIAACISPNFDPILGSRFGQPMAQIYYDSLGKSGALGFMSFVMICQFLMGLSVLVAASRQTWAFSRDGGLPMSRYLRRVNASLDYVPVWGILASVFVAALFGLLTLINPTAAQAVFSLGISAINLSWLIPILARVLWGQSRWQPGPFNLGRFSAPVAWGAVIFLIFGIVLSMMPVGGPDPSPAEMNYTVVINSALWLGALAYYAIDARKWFRGPVATLSDDAIDRAIKTEGMETSKEV